MSKSLFTPTPAKSQPALKVCSLRLIRIQNVCDMTGVSRSHLYHLMARGLFPESVPLVPGGKARAWVYEEVVHWINQRIADRGRGGKV